MDDKKMVKRSPYFGTEVKPPIQPNRKSQTVEQKPAEEPVQQPQPEPEKPKEEKPVAEKPEKVTDLLSGIVQTKTKSNVSFYLEDDIVVALDKLAKQNKTTRSILVNTLLRNLLLDK